MRTLVAFSGGLDSTYVLWKLLTTTNDEITAVFFDFSYLTDSSCSSASGASASSLSEYNKLVARNIVSYLKQTTRNFDFIIENCYSLNEDEDSTIYCARWAANKIQESIYDRYATGHEATVESREEYYRVHNMPARNRLSVGQAAKNAFSQITDSTKIWYPLSRDEWRKRTSEQLAELPSDLVQLSISCNNISSVDSVGNPVPCGQCNKCVRNNMLNQRLNLGETADQAWNYYTSSEAFANLIEQRKRVFSHFEEKPNWSN